MYLISFNIHHNMFIKLHTARRASSDPTQASVISL